MLLQLLFQNPIIFIMVAVALVVSISFHEFAHAYVADKLGDNTPRLLGRITLDPRAHLDPLGTLLLFVAGFGWGKPVPFNPINLANPKRDAALIAFAGPLANFILAVSFALLTKLELGVIFHTFFVILGTYNIVLGVFNLVPVHPLDGFKVVGGLLPPDLFFQWQQLERYGLFILMFLVLTDYIRVITTPFISAITLLLQL